jgi:hypothetical protein
MIAKTHITSMRWFCKNIQGVHCHVDLHKYAEDLGSDYGIEKYTIKII